MGVAVLDVASGRQTLWRADERFPMCSTFKWLLAAHVLARVDAGLEQLERRVTYDRRQLLEYSPVTASHAGGSGMSVGELCGAAVSASDNTAANLLLETLGGPAGFTARQRATGDSITRLDRSEPTLNTSIAGDERDTTTPNAMNAALKRWLLGDELRPASRAQLRAWMLATSTSGARLRSGLPPGWRLGDKTGTGENGSTNDVGIYWTPTDRAIVVSVFLTECTAPMAARNAAIAGVARRVTG